MQPLFSEQQAQHERKTSVSKSQYSLNWYLFLNPFVERPKSDIRYNLITYYTNNLVIFCSAKQLDVLVKVKYGYLISLSYTVTVY